MMSALQLFPKSENESATASVILTTHETNEHSMSMAIQSLENLEGVKEKAGVVSRYLIQIYFPKNEHNRKKIWRNFCR